MEQTLILVKPDGVRRGLTGEVLARFERRGFKIVALKMLTISDALAERHYGEHKGKPFYPGLIAFITSGPIVAAILEGDGAINAVRQMCGATDPQKAAPGSIRADYALSIGENIVHASDSPERAAIEMALFFPTNP